MFNIYTDFSIVTKKVFILDVLKLTNVQIAFKILFKKSSQNGYIKYCIALFKACIICQVHVVLLKFRNIFS